jgi:4-amino-4-deoxy-L-arabinose transferase-like glycosyltransferase
MEEMARTNFIKFAKNSWLIILVLLIASFLRLFRIGDYMTFLGDEGRDSLVVYNILHGHLTLLGPTASVGGFFLGPIYYYFMAPFLWIFGYNPVGPAVMVALVGILTVFLIYKVGEEFFGRRVGLLAALIYSIAPLIISYSRSSWNPNLMPFFSLLTLYSIYKGIEKEDLKFFLLGGFLLGISMQLHYLSVFLGAVLVAYLLIVRIIEKVRYKKEGQVLKFFKNSVLIFGGFLVGWSPFLAFELRHGFANIKSIFSFILHSGATGAAGSFLDILRDVFFRLFGRLVTNFPPPEQLAYKDHTQLFFWTIFTFALGILSFGFLLYKTLTEKDEIFFKRNLLVLIWISIGIFLFGFYKKSIYDYYFGFMFPAPFLLVSFFLDRLYKTSFKLIAVFIFLLILVLNLMGVPFQYLPNRQLMQVKNISYFVLDKTGGKPFNFALITGGNSDYAYRYFFVLRGQEPIAIQNPQIDPARKSVTEELLIVCESLPCRPLGNSLWEIAGFGRAQIDGQWNVSVVQIYKLSHYRGK